MKKDIVEFVRTKDFKFIMEIGQGGLGRTVLLRDDIINEHFVCKKYSPINEEDKDHYFKNFVDEIKILHLMYHKNIVRVFNYYLYPEQKTGYILMEYIQGADVQEYLKTNPDKLNDIFIQAIEGFKYLEQKNILHRDIRPQNILVSNEGCLKIIDFGFGKKIEFEKNFGKSITLNWWCATPDEFENQRYDFKTEIYFVGKLFEEIVIENDIENFPYLNLLRKMITKYKTRIESFFDISRKITEDSEAYIEFDDDEKYIYRRFAQNLRQVFVSITKGTPYIDDIGIIIHNLEDAYKSSMLEDVIPDPATVTSCFIKGGYMYQKSVEFPMETIKDFINLLKGIPIEKQKIVINNLWKQLDTVKRTTQYFETDDLPF